MHNALGRWSVVALTAVLLVALALRWTPPSEAQDLQPRPDALEYEEGARNMVHGAGYWIVVDGHRYPPRYPFGFSALMAPLLWFCDQGPGAGVIVVLAAAIVSVGMTWAIGYVAGGVVSAAAAGLLLAISPGHVVSSRMVMADVPASCAAAVLTFGALVALTQPSSKTSWFVLGLLASLSATIRMTNVLVAIPIVVCLLFQRPPEGGRMARLIAFAAGGAAGLAPLGMYNWTRFGSPLASGYGLWVPGEFFSWRNVVGPPAGGGTQPNCIRYRQALAGDGTLYPWPVVPLVVLGVYEAVREGGAPRLLCLLALSSLGLLTMLHLTFFWQGTRFLLPALPPLMALAAAPLSRRAGPVVKSIGAALMAMALLTALRSPEAYARNKVLHEADTLREVGRRIEPNAVLVAGTNDHFFQLLLRADGADRIWVPLGLNEHQFAVRWFHLPSFGVAPTGDAWIDQTLEGAFDGKRTEEMIRTARRDGRPVYLLSLRPGQRSAGPEIITWLAARFRMEPVGSMPASAGALFRVGEPRSEDSQGP